MEKALRWLRAWGPVLLYGALIVFLSSRSDLPKVRLSDKLIHFCEYALLAFLVSRALFLLAPHKGAVRAALWAVALATAFGITDEAHQFFVPKRDASLGDLLADLAGSLTGAGLYLLWLQALRRLVPGRVERA